MFQAAPHLCPHWSQDFDVVESILQEYKAFLKAHPLVDKTLPMHVYMSAYEEDGLRVSVSVRPGTQAKLPAVDSP